MKCTGVPHVCSVCCLLPWQAGKYVKEEVVWSLVAAVSNAADLQGYTVRALYRAFHEWSGQV